jgi:hypothetical protein
MIPRNATPIGNVAPFGRRRVDLNPRAAASKSTRWGLSEPLSAEHSRMWQLVVNAATGTNVQANSTEAGQ